MSIPVDMAQAEKEAKALSRVVESAIGLVRASTKRMTAAQRVETFKRIAAGYCTGCGREEHDGSCPPPETA